ncbi:MAG: tetratricopeptide repeat protein [Bacteroidota bacterium]|nr:tetratricopeptide repeat protein [Bacteroidota bacterium]
MRGLLIIKILLFLIIASFNAIASDKDSLLTILNSSQGEKRAEILLELCKNYRGRDTDTALYYCNEATKIYKAISGKTSELANSYHNTGVVFYIKGEYNTAISYFLKAYEIRDSIGDIDGASNSLNNLGVMHRNLGQLETALKYYIKALILKERKGDKAEMVGTINNIGSLYYTQKNHEKALHYFEKAQLLYKEQNDKAGLAATYNNLSLIYYEKNEREKAMDYNQLSFNLRKELNDEHGMAVSYNNFGRIFEGDNNNEKALIYYLEAEKTYRKIKDKQNLASSLNNIGGIHIKFGNYAKAKEYIFESLSLAESIDNISQIKENYFFLSEVNFKLGNYKNAYNYLRDYNLLKDSILNKESTIRVEEMEAKYETGQKEKEIALLTKEKEIQQLSRETEQNRNKIILNALLTGFGFIIVIAVLLLFMNRQKQKANTILEAQNIKIINSKVEIEGKNLELGIKNKEITDSIIYAKRIQEAIFPPDTFFKELLQDSFVLFKPKDIVSGDFYWVNKSCTSEIATTNEGVLFAAVDCTGHGVPGAFMSIVGYNLLNKAVNENQLNKPSEILNYLNLELNQTLRQTYEESKVKDGMDISLCSLRYDKSSSERGEDYAGILEYAGAYNPVWILRENSNNEPELIEIKPDKHPIGAFLGEELKPFTNNEIKVKKGDKIYIFTDGYADQFGGPKGKKYKYSQLKSLLFSIYNKTMEDQKNILEEVLERWKGDLEQVDDICVVGICV